jgi:hypothetical protein
MNIDNPRRIPGASTATLNPQDRAVRHLNQVDLSRRWKLSPRTLERWRWLRQGPRYIKVGGRVIYRVEDVEAYEADRVRQPEGPQQAPVFKRHP